MVSVLPEGDPDKDKKLIEDPNIREVMMQVQDLPEEERRTRNGNLIKSLSTLKTSQAGGFIWMKAHLHPSTCKTMLEDQDLKSSRLADIIKKLKLGGKKKRTKLIATLYSDLIKDVVILAILLKIIGMSFVFQFSSFPSFLTWIFLSSILVPLGLSAIQTIPGDPTIILGRKAWTRYRVDPPSAAKRFFLRSFIALFYFTIPAILVNAREEAKEKQKKLLECGEDQLLQSEDKTLTRGHLKKVCEINDYIEETRKAILTFKRNELSLEVVVQIVLQTTMVLLGPNLTKHSATHTGLQKVYDEDQTGVSEVLSQYDKNITTGLLVFSILWSFKTIATTYIKIKTEERKEFFPLVAKIILGVRTHLIYSVRISCILSFFGPFLGLLDCLSHWKADQLREDPPEFTAYTVVSLATAFVIFIGLLLCQIVVVFTVKLLISAKFRKDLSAQKVGRILQHLALTVNLPDNYNDWDLDGGSVAEHQQRRGQVLIENSVLIVIQAVFNMLMLIPIWVTGELTNAIGWYVWPAI